MRLALTPAVTLASVLFALPAFGDTVVKRSKQRAPSAGTKAFVRYLTAPPTQPTQLKAKRSPLRPPSWLVHWTQDLRRELKLLKPLGGRWDHPVAAKPTRWLSLDDDGGSSLRAWSTLRCPNQRTQVRVLQSSSVGFVLGVELLCQRDGGRKRWVRAGVWTDRQGEVQYSAAVSVTSKGALWPVRMSTLARSFRAQVSLTDGSILAQVSVAERSPAKPTQLPGPIPFGVTGPQTVVRRCALVFDHSGAELMKLFCGSVEGLPRERKAARARRALERRVPPATGVQAESISTLGISELRVRGQIFWMIPVARPTGDVSIDAGVACWTRLKGKWTRVPLPLPRTKIPGLWSCITEGNRLRCDFDQTGRLGDKGLAPRHFAWEGGQWREHR